MLFVGTAFPVAAGWASMIDVIRGPVWESVEITTLERIHSMLTNFVENYSGTIAELKTRLQLMVDDERLLFVAGEYSIKKK